MGLGHIPASAIDEPIEGNKMQRTVGNYNEVLLPRRRRDRRKKRIIEVAGFLVGRRPELCRGKMIMSYLGKVEMSY